MCLLFFLIKNLLVVLINKQTNGTPWNDKGGRLALCRNPTTIYLNHTTNALPTQQ